MENNHKEIYFSQNVATIAASLPVKSLDAMRADIVDRLMNQYNAAVLALPAPALALALKWYALAQAWALAEAGASGYPVDVVCAVLAMLSPQKKWTDNTLEASAVLALGSQACHDTIQATMGRKFMTSAKEYEKCRAVMAAGRVMPEYFGLKTGSFYRDIFRLDSSAVTIDTWALRHALHMAANAPMGGFNKNDAGSVARYEFLQSCFIEAGARLGIAGYQVQSVTWVYARMLCGIID